MGVDLTLLPSAPNGLVLFAEGSSGDYFSLSLHNSFAILQLSYGSVTINLTSSVKLMAGDWHIVSVGRNASGTFITINSTYSSSTSSPEGMLRIDSPLFIGGITDLSLLPPVVMVTSGLMGCIRDLQINAATVNAVMDAQAGQAITSCPEPECSYVQCQNGGDCVSTAGGAGFLCQCPHGYGGQFCEVPLPLCSPNPCLYGGQCQEFGERMFVCQCPLQRAGRFCEEGKL